MAGLVDATWMSGLRRLHLGTNGVRVEDVHALVEAPWFGGLRALDLSLNRFGCWGAVALAEAPSISNLQHLNLGLCGIRRRGATALANSPHLEGDLRSIWRLGWLDRAAHFSDAQPWPPELRAQGAP